MKKGLGVLCVVAILGLGTTVWAAGADFSGNWSAVGNASTMTIHQDDDAFRVILHNADGMNFMMHFIANGEEQQLRSQGQMQRMVRATWQGEDLLVNSRVLVNAKVRRRVDLRVSMGEDGNLHVALTRFNGQHQRTRNLVLQKQ